jgi:peptide/nickel transport system ATP-binding protein
MSQPAAELLRVEDLRIQFELQSGPIEVVRGVSFRVRPGSIVALVGESGSGKSVIAQSIMGILPRVGSVSGGSAIFSDPERPGVTQDITKLDSDGAEMRKLRGARMAMIFQEPMTSLSPLHTIGDQIEEALRLHQEVSEVAYRTRTEEMLALAGFPDPARAYDMYPFELSGGLRQRAMIAMALICRPALLIADEPTTALDVTIQAQILKLIRDLQQKLGMAVLLITHDLGVVANMADEVVVIYHGEIMESGPVKDIFTNPQHPYLKALLAAVPHFDMKPGERLVSLRDVKVEAEGLMAPSARPQEAAGTPLLEVKGLAKSFIIRKGGFLFSRESSRLNAVAGVSFDIRRGECLGLVGESGCGKTTVSKLLMRGVTADAGQVNFHDAAGPIDMLALHGGDLKRFRTRIQMVFQDPFSSLSPRMTVSNVLQEPLEFHGIGNDASRLALARELMGLVGLDPRFLSRYPHSFSGGQRQRIGIARALALKPDLLICDEPVSALDVSIQAQILNLLKDLKSELGLTYLFVSHNLAVVDYIADRIAVMCSGRLVELAPRDQLFQRPVHPYTKALLSAVPEPDPDHRLDLGALMEGRASDPAAWPAPFTVNGSANLAFVDLGGGHFVRADPSLSGQEAAQ